MSDQIDQLAKLSDLKNSGAITEEEFTEQKRKLLQGESAPAPKKTVLPLRSPKTWAIVIVAAIGYQAIKYGMAEADKLPTCQSDQAKNMVVELINKQIRENPLAAMVAGGARAISISSTKELHSDPAIRACEGVVKRNNGEGEIGYTIEMGNKEKGEFWVHIHGVDDVRAMYAKAETPKQPAPATQQTAPQATEQPKPAVAPQEAEKPIETKNAPNLSATHTKCMEQAASMPDMVQCSNEEAQRQDARLNSAYKAAMSSVADKDGLKAAQRQWIKERDKECAADEGGGQNAVLIAADCIAIKTASRADELERTR